MYASGEVVLDEEVEGVRQFVGAGRAGGKGLWAQWLVSRSPGDSRNGPYVGLRDNEGRFYAWKVDAMTRVTGALSEDVAFGYSAGRISLFALKAGYAYPLVGRPLEAPWYADGTAVPLYIAPGPFVRVAGANTSAADCLNVRVNPALGASVLGCFRDGTLLRLADGSTSSLGSDRAPWYPVITPNGRGGWASGEFLVVP